MCVKPNHVYQIGPLGPKKIETPCRWCWACLKNRQNELVGKSLLELAASDWGIFLTLTYDDKRITDPLQKTMIHKADFQTFMKSVRNRITTCRYVAAGEYGEKRGRAHFHVALMGLGIPPNIPLKKRVHLSSWPWGHVWTDALNVNSMRYIAKYLTKARSEKTKKTMISHEEWVTYSKKPPLGLEYVLRWAELHAEEKVFPRSFRINPPGAREKDRYQISGLSQHLFLERICQCWPEAETVQKTEWMENAMTRLRKWRAQKLWDTLTPEEQSAEIETMMRRAWPRPELTEAEKYALRYERELQYCMDEDWGYLQKWLDDRAAAAMTERKALSPERKDLSLRDRPMLSQPPRK